MQIVTVLGTAATAYGLASMTAPLLQLQRMRRSGSSKDVSLGTLMIGIGGSLLWLCYGLALANIALILVDLGTLATGLASLIVAVSLRRKWQPDVQHPHHRSPLGGWARYVRQGDAWRASASGPSGDRIGSELRNVAWGG